MTQMKDQTINRAMAISALVVCVATYNVWPFLWKGFFYQGMAVHFILVYGLSFNLARDRTPDYFVSKCMFIGFWLAINNLFDELVFNPKKIELNEYITALIIICIILLKPNKNGR